MSQFAQQHATKEVRDWAGCRDGLRLIVVREYIN